MTHDDIYRVVGLGMELNCVRAVGEALDKYLREPVQAQVQDHRGMCVDTGEYSICYTNAETMHLRIGHPFKEVTRRMKYPFLTKPCKWCLMGKSRIAVSPTKPIPKGRARLDKVHVVKISNTPGRNGRTRMLGIVDTYS